VNLGSLHLARGEANDAARMYAAALTRFYGNKDPKVSVWMARAHYDALDHANCKRALLKAIHSFPDDQALHFNLALTMQHSASAVRLPIPSCHASHAHP
jgi:RNA polymerase-associated protein CTR9